jgi:hypothetical protein
MNLMHIAVMLITMGTFDGATALALILACSRPGKSHLDDLVGPQGVGRGYGLVQTLRYKRAPAIDYYAACVASAWQFRLCSGFSPARLAVALPSALAPGDDCSRFD